MTIECELCGDQVWCLRFKDEWVCKNCFIDERMGDYNEWRQLNEEAKQKRRIRQMMEFDDNHVSI